MLREDGVEELGRAGKGGGEEGDARGKAAAGPRLTTRRVIWASAARVWTAWHAESGPAARYWACPNVPKLPKGGYGSQGEKPPLVGASLWVEWVPSP